MGPLKKGQRVINVFEGPKLHTIYEGTVVWTINDNIGHTHQVEITNYLYVTKGWERLTSTQHWAHNATYINVDATTRASLSR